MDFGSFDFGDLQLRRSSNGNRGAALQRASRRLPYRLDEALDKRSIRLLGSRKDEEGDEIC